MLSGGLFDMPLKLFKNLVERVHHCPIELDTFTNLGVFKSFSYAVMVLLGIGIKNMGNQFRAAPGDVHAAAQQVADDTLLGRIWVCGGKISALEQQGNFIGIDFIIFCFATVVVFHV